MTNDDYGNFAIFLRGSNESYTIMEMVSVTEIKLRKPTLSDNFGTQLLQGALQQAAAVATRFGSSSDAKA